MSSMMMQLTFLIVILTRALQMSLKLMMNCLLDVLPDQHHSNRYRLPMSVLKR